MNLLSIRGRRWVPGLALVFGVGTLTAAFSILEQQAQAAPAIPNRAAETEARKASPPSGPAKIMPLSEVKAGMVGEALTVFSGTKPEPFKVRVISVVQNFLPKQDIILVRAEDERVEFSGIAAGMSGSPVYIDGKLIGAIAYAWTFSKSPLAGVTPIETMLVEQKRPRRSTRERLDTGELVAAPGGGPVEVSDSSPAPASTGGPLSVSGFGEPKLRPVSVPLSVSGFSGPALDLLTDELKPYGIVPMRTGTGGGRRAGTALPQGAEGLVPGGAVGVQLIKGDMNATAIGTVTWVDGKSLIAFGHPMFGSGEVSLPMVTGEVHTFIPSQASSFKLASPIAEVGAIVQDRPSCIVGDMGLRATMMPIEVRVRVPGSAPRIFRAELARSKRLMPNLAAAVLMSAIADAEPDQTEMAVRVTSRLAVHGAKPVELRDVIFAPDGLAGPRSSVTAVKGLRAMVELLANPFAPVRLDRLDFDVEIEFRKDLAEIVAVGLPGEEVRAGDSLPLRVTLRPYAGREYSETIAVKIPERLAGQAIKVEVASGALVRPESARPESIGDLIDNLRTNHYTASSIVVSLSLPDDGASLRGRLLPELPAGALDTLRPGNLTRRAEGYRLAQRTVFDSPRPVAGRQELTVYVREDILGRQR